MTKFAELWEEVKEEAETCTEITGWELNPGPPWSTASTLVYQSIDCDPWPLTPNLTSSSPSAVSMQWKCLGFSSWITTVRCNGTGWVQSCKWTPLHRHADEEAERKCPEQTKGNPNYHFNLVKVTKHNYSNGKNSWTIPHFLIFCFQRVRF